MSRCFSLLVLAVLIKELYTLWLTLTLLYAGLCLHIESIDADSEAA